MKLKKFRKKYSDLSIEQVNLILMLMGNVIKSKREESFSGLCSEAYELQKDGRIDSSHQKFLRRLGRDMVTTFSRDEVASDYAFKAGGAKERLNILSWIIYLNSPLTHNADYRNNRNKIHKKVKGYYKLKKKQ